MQWHYRTPKRRAADGVRKIYHCGVTVITNRGWRAEDWAPTWGWMRDDSDDGWAFAAYGPAIQVTKSDRSLWFVGDCLEKTKVLSHLDVSSYQVRWLLVCLQGHVDGGERPAGHLLHLPQQLLRKGRKEEEESEGQWQMNTDCLLSIIPSLTWQNANRFYYEGTCTVWIMYIYIYWSTMVHLSPM